MGQAISNILGEGEGGKDGNSYQETRKRVAVEDRWKSGGTQQTILNGFQPNPHWEEILNSSSNDTRLSASSTEAVDSSRRVAIAQECGQIGGTQQNLPKSLLPELKSSSNTRLSTCPTKVADSNRKSVEDSSITKVAEKSGQSGGTQRNAQKGSNKKPRGKKEILHSSSNNTKLSTSSSKKVAVSRRRVGKESGGSGGTQQNVPEGFDKKLRGKKEILHSSSNNTKLSTSSTKVAVSSRGVGKESGGSGGTQQNVLKSSKEKPRGKKEILHSSSNDTKLSTPSSTKVAVSSRRVDKESGGSGGTQQNVWKSSKEKPRGKKKILHSSSNNTKLSTPSTKVTVSSSRVGKESGGSCGAQQNVRKSSKEKPHGNEEILHISSNDTKLSTPSSTKVAVSSRRVDKKSGGSGGTQQNVPKSPKKKLRGKKKILQVSSSVIILSTCPTKVVDSSRRRVIEKSHRSGGTKKNVRNSSKIKTRIKKVILKQKKHYQSSSKRQLGRDENIEFWKSKYGKAICTINELKESPCFKQLFEQWNIPLQVINHSGFLCRWIAPPAGWVSLNTDGALNQANASCGGLIRDNKGKVLQFHAAVDRQAIHHIELLAIAHGLGVALEGGRGRIWVQSDSKSAIDIINGEYSPPCNSIAIVDEIKRKMEQFEEIRFSHVFREMNKPADLIAKWGVGDLSIYGHPIPKELDTMVQKDAKGAWYFRKYKGDTDEMDQ